MGKLSSSIHSAAEFGDHAVTVAKRQYFQPGDESVFDMFERVASWVAQPEPEERREDAAAEFYRLMAEQRFCPGGRVLAGAATAHGNVLNCFVQDGSPEQEGTNDWILLLARKLALVTKVGGGNGLNLDPIPPKRHFAGKVGKLFLTVDAAHQDYEAIKSGTYLDLVRNEMVTKGYRVARFVERTDAPDGAEVVTVPDSVEGIWDSAGSAAIGLLAGRDVLVDLSSLRPVGTPVRGSGGASSGPSSFAVEIFDNFAMWAGLGGVEYAGPVATLRYVFAPTLRAIRQGGCLHPDTLVYTSRGTLRLEELVDGHQLGWQDHHVKVATDEGWKDSPRGFNNGVVDTLRVTLANGQTLRGTANHKLKVIRPDGQRVWVEFADLQKGDHVIQVLDQHTGAPVLLRPVDLPHHNTKPIRMPEVLDERLAFFLGYLWGDGFISTGRVGFAVSHDSPMIKQTPRMFDELFGLGVVTEQKQGDASVIFVTKSAQLIAWLKANGLTKEKARELAIPKAIRMSPRPVVGAFLRGLFEADGSISHGMPLLSTASVRLAEDVATMLAGLGIPTKRRTTSGVTDRYSKHSIHGVRVVSHKGLERFLERVGALPGSRLEAAGEHVPDEARENSWLFPPASAMLTETFEALPAGAKGLRSQFTATRKTLSRHIRGERHLTATGHARLGTNPQLVDVLPEFGHDECYVPVLSVSEAGRSLTLDLSVDENKTYLAGGFVTHNTRRGAGMATISITHPDVQDFITAKDLERERDEGDISTFNISVLVTDGFMQDDAATSSGVLREIAQHAWATGEPGLIFVDRINEHNTMRGMLGDILSTNPCGEIPLYPGEPCDLGAINLAKYVVSSGIGMDGFDMPTFRQEVGTCVRFLDDVLDVNRFALEDNRDMSMKLRRLGLGVMGLADALIKMGFGYNTDEGREAVAAIIGIMRDAATEASEALAVERGAFPLVAQSDLDSPRRNVAILTVAPTGTTSMLMGVSSGVEPVFAPFIHRKIGADYHALIHPLFQELLDAHEPTVGYAANGRWDWDAVVKAVQDNHGSVQGLEFIPEAVRRVLICAHDITPTDHVKMQATVQRAFDGGEKVANSISKTINMPNTATVDDVHDAYRLAFETGCKGITVYRDGSRQFQVLSTTSDRPEAKEAERPAAAAANARASAAGAHRHNGSAPTVQAPPSVKGPGSHVAVALGAAPSNPPAPRFSDRLPGEPLFERTVRLSGFTDQVKLMEPSGEKRGFYVTVNKQDGLPTEVFILSGKGGDEANADSEALGRVVSIALQYGVPAEALVKTLRGINGGMYGTYHGRMVASKADILAVALETAGAENVLNHGKGCPECGAPLRFEEGCQKCESCGYSKCG